MKYLAVCLLLAAGYCQADVVTRNLYRNFYDSLADYLKAPFLRYQLAVALIEQTPNSKVKPYPLVEDSLLTAEGLGVPEIIFYNLKALETPVGFSTRLYTLVTEDLGMNVYQVVNLIKKSYACNDKGCWDIGDVGSNCC